MTQGFECKVLRPYLTSESNPDVFIPYIFMEWMHVRNNLDNNCPDLGGLVALFESNGYYPVNPNTKKTLDVKGVFAKQIDGPFYVTVLDYLQWNGMDDLVWFHKNAQKLY